MKISELVKQLNKAKRLYGDLRVSFDETTVDDTKDPTSCITEVVDCGVFMVTPDEVGRPKKQFVLFVDGDSVFPDDTKNYLALKKAK